MLIKARMAGYVLIIGVLSGFLPQPLFAANAPDEADLSIGRMRIMVWPEYDDSGMLVVYDGRFVEEQKFPTKTSFIIPKGVVINDVCSLSPGGQHFCQLYDVEKGSDYDIAHMSLPYSNFYLSFHTASLDMTSAKRNIDYKLKANHNIRSLEIDIQQPLRSSDFKTNISGVAFDGKVKEKQGFNHYEYTLKDIPKGKDKLFNIAYVKEDANPSVDIKFASMSGPRVWGSPYEAQRKIKTIIYAVFASGVLLAVGGMYWLFVLKRRKKVAQ